MAEMQIGDVVQLKVGGPIMTVDRDMGDEQYLCVWFDDKQERKAHVFPVATLEKYEEPSIG